MDINDITNRVQRQFGDDANIMLNQADVINWTNEAQMRIARETNCLTGSSTAAAGTFPVNYPADFIRVRRLLYGTTALEMVEIEDLDQKGYDLTQQNTPQFYYLVNNQIALYPDPLTADTTTVTIQYAKQPTKINTAADALTLPVHMHDDVTRFCLMRARERNEDWKGMEVAASEFQSTAALRLEDTDNPEDTYPVVRDDPYENWV